MNPLLSCHDFFRCRRELVSQNHLPSLSASALTGAEDKRIDSAVRIDENINERLEVVLEFERRIVAERCPHPVAVPRQHTHNEHQDGEAEHLNDPLVALQTLLHSQVLLFGRLSPVKAIHVELFKLLGQLPAGARVTVSNDGQRYAVVDDEKRYSVVFRIVLPRPFLDARYADVG